MVGKLTPDDILTASVLPAVMNMSTFKTPNDALAKAIAVIENQPDPDPFNGNEATFWGDRLEPVILSEAVERLGLIDAQLDFDSAFMHPELPFACSLDGLATGSGTYDTNVGAGIYCPNGAVTLSGKIILEAKNTSAQATDEAHAARGLWQLQGQMMCTGVDAGVIATLFRGGELRLFMYQADAAMQSRIIHAIHDFERRKRDRDWYPAVSSSDANTAYGRVDDGAPPLTLDDEMSEWLAQLVNAKAAKKIAEQDIDEAETVLKEFMGSHEKASGSVGNVGYAVQWPMRNYKASPAKTTPAKPARRVRQNTLIVKEAFDG